MDTVIEKLERLAELAASRQDPAPLDASGIMARIRGLDIEEDDVRDPLPIRFVAGGAMAVAAAAAFVATIGVSAWQEIANPSVIQIESLLALNTILEPIL